MLVFSVKVFDLDAADCAPNGCANTWRIVGVRRFMKVDWCGLMVSGMARGVTERRFAAKDFFEDLGGALVWAEAMGGRKGK